MSFHVRVQSSSKQVQDSSWTRSSVEDSGLTIMSVCCCYTDPPQDGISQMVFIQNCKAKKRWCTSGHEGLPHTEECKGLPSICDSISENQRVSAFENIFHQILHRACEQLPLCCLRAIHLSKEGKRHSCTDGKLIVSYLNMRNSPTFWPETEQKRQGMDHL